MNKSRLISFITAVIAVHTRTHTDLLSGPSPLLINVAHQNGKTSMQQQSTKT